MTDYQNRINRLVAKLNIRENGGDDSSTSAAFPRGIQDVARCWQKLDDSDPELQWFRDFGLSLLTLTVKGDFQYLSNPSWRPENVDQDSDLSPSTMLQIVSAGIPLIWAPGTQVTSALMDAPIGARENRLLSSLQAICKDCIETLSKVVDSDLQVLARMAINSAVDLAHRNQWAAQALAANVLGTWVRWLSSVAPPVSESYSAPFSEGNRFQVIRQLYVLTPIAAALEPVQPGTAVPMRFNANASAHRVSTEQYNTLNALIAVMLVSSALRETQESRWLH